MNTEWKIETDPIDYDYAIKFMEDKVAKIRNNGGDDLVWLLEHPHIYTAGTSAKADDLLRHDIPVYQTGRGGEYTYHGAGQRIAYAMVDLKKRESDLRKYIHDLEEWIILTLSEFNIKGERREGRVGIWVVSGNRENKIAAIGVRVRKWVAYHGISINVNPELSYYEGIVPCGIKDYGITSFAKLGVNVSMSELDEALKRNWNEVF